MGKQGYFRFMLLMAAIVVAVLPATACGVSQGSPGPAANSVASASPREGPQEGIKVHGHWTIEVTNPDGTLAERREFENALISAGGDALAKFLGRKQSVGQWTIFLHGPTPSGSPFVNSFGIEEDGLIIEGSSPASFNVFYNLLVDVPETGTNAKKLELRGSATAQRNGTIVAVSTGVNGLAASGGGSSWPFTGKLLTSPQALSAGQQIAVTVVIGFS